MKTLLSLAGSLALTCWLLPAHAQTAPAQVKTVRKQAAERRTDTYQGPMVVKDSKKLGQKMLEKGKPADAIIMRAPLLK